MNFEEKIPIINTVGVIILIILVIILFTKNNSENFQTGIGNDNKGGFFLLADASGNISKLSAETINTQLDEITTNLADAQGKFAKLVEIIEGLDSTTDLTQAKFRVPVIIDKTLNVTGNLDVKGTTELEDTQVLTNMVVGDTANPTNSSGTLLVVGQKPTFIGSAKLNDATIDTARIKQIQNIPVTPI